MPNGVHKWDPSGVTISEGRARKVVGYPAVWFLVWAVRDAGAREDGSVPSKEFDVSKVDAIGQRVHISNSIVYQQVTQRGPVERIWLPRL